MDNFKYAEKDCVLRLADQSKSYTIEEEKAIQEFYDLIETDETLQQWRKLALKPIVIYGLRMCKMEVVAMFELVRVLYRIVMVSLPDLLSRCDPKNLEYIATLKFFQILKRPIHDDGPTVIITRIDRWDPTKASLDDIILFAALFFVFAARSSIEMQTSGILAVFDMQGLSLAHIRHVTTLENIRKAAYMSLKVPVKLSTKVLQGSVLINSSSLAVRTFNTLKWLIKKKIQKRVEITQSDRSFITNLKDPSFLPTELGGTIPNDEAYLEGVEQELLSDINLVPSLESIKNKILRYNGFIKN